MGGEMLITVVIVYSSKPRELFETELVLEKGSSVSQALEASGLLTIVSPDGASIAGQGVWGKKVGLTHILRDKDRLEIYRSLTVDPKVARRERFVGQGAKKAAGLFATRRAGAKAGY